MRVKPGRIAMLIELGRDPGPASRDHGMMLKPLDYSDILYSLLLKLT